MAIKDRDYDQLMAFQRAGIDYGQKISEIARRISQAAVGAQAELRDRVSAMSIDKIVRTSHELRSLGMAIETDMSAHLSKTIQEADEFNNL